MHRDIIAFNYDEMEEFRVQLNRLYERLEQLYNHIHLECGELKTTWKGKASEEFFSEMENDVFPRLRRLVAAMDEAGHSVSQITEIFDSNESDASRLFGGR